jgi:hypothetical protein
MSPDETVAEFVVDIIVKAETEGFADRFADAYDVSALSKANEAELGSASDCGTAGRELTLTVTALVRMPVESAVPATNT